MTREEALAAAAASGLAAEPGWELRPHQAQHFERPDPIWGYYVPKEPCWMIPYGQSPVRSIGQGRALVVSDRTGEVQSIYFGE